MFIFTAMHGISTDGLGIKEIHSPATLGILIEIMLTVGELIGSVVLIKLVSANFARNFGLSQPLMTLQTFIMILSIIIFVMAVVVHFYMPETGKLYSI
jgi:hypothetical protein